MGYEPRIRHISALKAHTKVFNMMGYEPRIRRISAHFFFFLLALVMFVLLDYKGVVDDFIAHCSRSRSIPSIPNTVGCWGTGRPWLVPSLVFEWQSTLLLCLPCLAAHWVGCSTFLLVRSSRHSFNAKWVCMPGLCYCTKLYSTGTSAMRHYPIRQGLGCQSNTSTRNT